jgi:predicted acylesterase/phospholipase RssA
MLVLQTAKSPRTKLQLEAVLLKAVRRKAGRPARIGLAVAGGGPLGGMYELGALRALDEAIVEIDMTALDVYVGVSSGALIAAGQELLPVLARHGLSLRKDVLEDDARTLLGGLRDPHGRKAATASRLHRALDVLDRKLPVAATLKRTRAPSPRVKRKAT